MATYYVRKTGSNAAAGTTPATAWQTIGKALNTGSTVAAGDTVYIGAGVYREIITVGITPASLVTVIGDYTGEFTGDAGEVRLTSYLTSDVNAGAGGNLFSPNGKSNFLIRNLTLVCANGSQITQATGTASNWTFRDCAIIGGSTTPVSWTQAAVGSYSLLLERCVIVSGTTRTATFNLSAPLNVANVDYDVGAELRNCLLLNGNGTIGVKLTQSGGTGTGKPGGLKVNNCSLFGGSSGVSISSSALSTTIPILVYNSVLIGQGTNLNANTSGQIVEDYNYLWGGTARANVTAGTHSISGDPPSAGAPLFDFGQAALRKLPPLPFLTPTFDSPVLGYGNQAVGVTDDAYGTTRPSPASLGALERRAGTMQILKSGLWVPVR